jgi:hypothetical protein
MIGQPVLSLTSPGISASTWAPPLLRAAVPYFNQWRGEGAPS